MLKRKIKILLIIGICSCLIGCNDNKENVDLNSNDFEIISKQEIDEGCETIIKLKDKTNGKEYIIYNRNNTGGGGIVQVN